MNPFGAASSSPAGGAENEATGSYHSRFRTKVTRAMSHVSLRTRITALVMVAVGVSVALASVAAFITVRNQVLSQQDTSLLANANALTLNRIITPDPDKQVTSTYLLAINLRFSRLYANDTAIPDVPIAASTLVPAAADFDVAKGLSKVNIHTIHGSGYALRAVTVPLGPDSALMVAEPMDATYQTLGRLSLVSILVGIAGIAMAGSAGIAVGRAGLRPVDRLTEATEHVARTGDLRLIEVQGTDELARLATSFNAMLAAVSRSQEHQKRLIADAGHELRTPLTSMRTNIDLLAQVFGPGSTSSAGISDADRDELISDVRAQMEELSVLVGDLVELSRDVKPTAAPEPVNLADIVQQAVERVRLRAPDVDYAMTLDAWFLEGDPAALERAVTNLLDNAAKWSPDDGTVTVTLHDGLLQVSDHGPGISDADLPHVFERFYRSTEARTMPGSGLGLAIVRQAAENHGGRVAAAHAPGGGALLGLWLPGRSGGATPPDAAPVAPA